MALLRNMTFNTRTALKAEIAEDLEEWQWALEQAKGNPIKECRARMAIERLMAMQDEARRPTA